MLTQNEQTANEIVVEITSYLLLLGKLSLACVSKQLHETISDNTLYNKLVFRDETKFNEAMTLYKKRNFGQQVRDLSIGNMGYDSQLVLALPALFPRVRFLNFEGGQDKIGEIKTHVLKAVASNWKGVERIVDSSNIMNVTFKLLGHLNFDHLRSLELGCDYLRRVDVKERNDKTQALIKVIHNPPALEKLVFKYSAVKLHTLKSCMQKQQD